MLECYKIIYSFRVVNFGKELLRVSDSAWGLFEQEETSVSTAKFDFKTLPDKGLLWEKEKDRKSNFVVKYRDEDEWYSLTETIKQTKYPNAVFYFIIEYKKVSLPLSKMLEVMEPDVMIEYLRERGIGVPLD